MPVPEVARKTHQMRLVEQRFGGMEVEDILISLYEKHHSLRRVAATIDVPLTTVSRWFRDLGLSELLNGAPR